MDLRRHAGESRVDTGDRLLARREPERSIPVGQQTRRPGTGRAADVVRSARWPRPSAARGSMSVKWPLRASETQTPRRSATSPLGAPPTPTVPSTALAARLMCVTVPRSGRSAQTSSPWSAILVGRSPTGTTSTTSFCVGSMTATEFGAATIADRSPSGARTRAMTTARRRERGTGECKSRAPPAPATRRPAAPRRRPDLPVLRGTRSCERMRRSRSLRSGPGSMPSSSASLAPRVAIDLERFRLPPRSIEGEHALPDQPLAVGMAPRERL